jgi:hypothetical protein
LGAVLLCIFALSGCGVYDDPGGGVTDDGSISVTFDSARQIGYTGSNGTAQIRLVVDRDISLEVSDITAVDWENDKAITVSSLHSAGGAYTFMLDGITASGSGIVIMKLAKDAYAFKPASRPVRIVMYSGPPVVDPGNGSIKAKFGITDLGTDGVKAAFNALHNFIDRDGLAALPDVIRLGDWIDLEGGLTVEAYSGTDGMGGGDCNYDGTSEYTRLIVVGINSFQDGGSDGNSAYKYQGTDAPPDHAVFQFKQIPAQHRMNPTNTNSGGYGESEMRKYLVPYSGSNGNFLIGLENAGVPVNVLWAPVRRVGFNGGPADVVTDLLWLPTEREIFGTEAGASSNETARNQAWLEYYKEGGRFKYATPSAGTYWEATPEFVNNYGNIHPTFCHVQSHLLYSQDPSEASHRYGVVPAFCVR